MGILRLVCRCYYLLEFACEQISNLLLEVSFASARSPVQRRSNFTSLGTEALVGQAPKTHHSPVLGTEAFRCSPATPQHSGRGNAQSLDLTALPIGLQCHTNGMMAVHDPGSIRILNGCVARLMSTAYSNGKAPLKTCPGLLSYNLKSNFNEHNTVGTIIINAYTKQQAPWLPAGTSKACNRLSTARPTCHAT